MTSTDAGLLPAAFIASPRKKSFFVEEDEIIVKPSTELIPDEYEHFTNETVLFHIFRTTTPTEKNLADDLLHSVQEINYEVDEKNNIHDLGNLKKLTSDLEAIKKESMNVNALVLVFIGYGGEEEKRGGTLLLMDENGTSQNVQLTKIWNTFTANDCAELKYKPKIFIFCTSRKPVAEVQTDSIRHRTMDFDKVYDFPAESDLLIVYEKDDEVFPRNKVKFIEQLCSNIENFSKKYDIIDLVSHIHEDNYMPTPLVISTLTRKFYLTPSNEREHHLSIAENHYHIEETLQKIQENVQKLHDAQKKKKERNFFSFRKKTEEKPKIEKRKTPDVEQVRVGSKSKMDAPVSVPAAASRLSTGSTSGLAGRKLRKQSETDSSAARKKPWKF